MGNKLKTHWVETTIKIGNESSIVERLAVG